MPCIKSISKKSWSLFGGYLSNLYNSFLKEFIIIIIITWKFRRGNKGYMVIGGIILQPSGQCIYHFQFQSRPTTASASASVFFNEFPKQPINHKSTCLSLHCIAYNNNKKHKLPLSSIWWEQIIATEPLVRNHLEGVGDKGLYLV